MATAWSQLHDGLAIGTSPSDEKALKAELINGFNLAVVSLITAQQRVGGSIQSVQDIPGFFNRLTFQFRGQSRTLADLENRLAAMGDPRVFAALVRGALGCPPLRAEPYLASRLDQQLDEQCRLFLDDRSKNRAVRQALGVSEIFKWHEADFQVEPYNGTVGFLRRFSRPHGEVRDYLVGMNDRAKITFLPYDWRLNQSPDDETPAAKSPDEVLGHSKASSQPAHE
jgi:hypothetical protein